MTIIVVGSVAVWALLNSLLAVYVLSKQPPASEETAAYAGCLAFLGITLSIPAFVILTRLAFGWFS